MQDWSSEETDDPVVADDRYFFKVEQWTADDQHVERMLWAGNAIVRARAIFDAKVRHRPRGHYTIRQRNRVLQKWPEA
ncbi:MAG: hypothetical protein J2P55_00700 [Rhizobiales bacterium]|nr:hypothetical protein [Hyphomicrobiales bacterium]